MRCCAGIVLVMLLVVAQTDAQSRSAGELYRIAGRELPNAANAAEGFTLKDVLDAPLDESAKSIVQRAQAQLSLFDAASGMPFGQWGFDPSDPSYATRVIVGASDLADLVILRARLRAQGGQSDEALHDCGNLAVFSRRLSSEPSLVRMDQQAQLFTKACDLFGLIAIQSDPSQSEQLLKGIGELRSPIDPVVVATTERDAYLAFYRRLVSNSEMRSLAMRDDVPINALFGVNRRPVPVEDLWQDSKLADATFAEARQTFEEMTAALGLAGADRAGAMKKAKDRIRSSHAMVREIGDIFDRIVRLNETQMAMAGMLRSACGICAMPNRPIEPDAAGEIARPYSFEATTGGFDLRATLADSGDAVVLHIGPRLVRPRPSTAQATP